MKIALIITAKGIHGMRWANALAERGHDVTVLSCANHVGNFETTYHSGVKVIKLAFPAPYGYYLNACQVRRIIKKEKFDIVNVHYATGNATLGRLAGVKEGLLNVWGSDVYEFPYISKRNMRLIKKNLNYYSHVASTSYCMARQAKTLVDREFFITPFGVDTERFKPLDMQKPKDKIVIGTVKSLEPNYGIADTIEAFIRLVDRLKAEGKEALADKLYYDIYGKGTQKETLQKRIDESGMSDKIRLLGFVQNEKLPQIINGFTMFCCCSYSESFGVAAVEAMACGVPAVTSDADGFAEVMKDGETGIVVPKGDIEKIANALYTLLMDEEMRARMGRAGVCHVQANYDWPNNVDTMLNVYTTMLSKKKK